MLKLCAYGASSHNNWLKELKYSIRSWLYYSIYSFVCHSGCQLDLIYWKPQSLMTKEVSWKSFLESMTSPAHQGPLACLLGDPCFCHLSSLLELLSDPHALSNNGKPASLLCPLGYLWLLLHLLSMCVYDLWLCQYTYESPRRERNSSMPFWNMWPSSYTEGWWPRTIALHLDTLDLQRPHSYK